MIEGKLKQKTYIHLRGGVVYTIPPGRRVWVERNGGTPILRIQGFSPTFFKFGGRFWMREEDGGIWEVVFPNGGKPPFPFLLLSVSSPRKKGEEEDFWFPSLWDGDFFGGQAHLK